MENAMNTVEIDSAAHMPNGSAVAAILAAMIGILVLCAVVLLTEASEAAKESVHNLGKLWIPGAEGIGPYSGKETWMLIGWLLSWPLLHFVLRNRDFKGNWWLIVFLIGMGIGTTLIWPPMWHILLGN